MERPLLVISLALATLLLVMLWAWFTKRDALSGPHGFGDDIKDPSSSSTGSPTRPSMATSSASSSDSSSSNPPPSTAKSPAGPSSTTPPSKTETSSTEES